MADISSFQSHLLSVLSSRGLHGVNQQSNVRERWQEKGIDIFSLPNCWQRFEGHRRAFFIIINVTRFRYIDQAGLEPVKLLPLLPKR